MTAKKRQMHLAVFWLGTGNHAAGWRMEGAADSNCSWPIAGGRRPHCRARQIRFVLHLRQSRVGSERSSLVPDAPGADHRCLCLEPRDAPCRPRRHGLDELQRALHRRAHLPVAAASEQGTHRLERRDQQRRQRPAQLQHATPLRARPALRDCQRVPRCRARPVEYVGRGRRPQRQRDGQLRRSGEGAHARSQRALLPGARAPQRRAAGARSSVDHPSRRLGARARAVGTRRRHRLLGGERRYRCERRPPTMVSRRASQNTDARRPTW